MIIGVFATPEDRAYMPRLQPMLGVNAVKVGMTPIEYLNTLKLKVQGAKLDAIICTCPVTLVTLLNTQADFRHPLDKRGNKKKLSLNDYAGSFFHIPKDKLGTDNDIPVLILNPLQHLVSVPSGAFVFKRFISKLLTPNAWFPQTAFTWEIWKPANSAALLAKLQGARLLSVDIETYRGDADRRIHCVGYCALFHDGSTHSVVVPFKDMLAHSFVRQVNACMVPKLFQGGMYDNAYLARWNVPCENWLHDTLHAFHGWYAELPKRLDFITAFCVREIRYWKDDSAGGEWELFEYNARDCWATLMTYCAMMVEAPDWARTNYVIEFPYVFPCLHIELDGLRINKEKFARNKELAEQRLEAQAAPIRAWLGDNFNPSSPLQVMNLLKVLGIRDPEGSGEDVLIAAASAHPLNERILSAILAYRKQAKLLSTYFKEDKFWHDRLYYRTDPAGTESGRFASSESSFWCGLQIQNIPRGNAVKDWIECDEGWDGFGEGDYAQSEAYCVGYLSGCPALIELLESEWDYHKWNASAFFGVAYDAIDKPLRNLAKRVNHGANYNMGARVLLATMGPKAVAEARTMLKLPGSWELVKVCQYLLDTYAKTYPEVKKDWYDDIKRTIKLTKKLVSALGWTRYFFGDPMTNKQTLNAAVAHGPQNLSVSVINPTFYRIWRDSVYGDLRGKARLKAQIHDSIFYEYKGAEVPAIIKERMVNPIPVTDVHGTVRTMTIPVDMSIGDGAAKFWSDIK